MIPQGVRKDLVNIRIPVIKCQDKDHVFHLVEKYPATTVAVRRELWRCWYCGTQKTVEVKL